MSHKRSSPQALFVSRLTESRFCLGKASPITDPTAERVSYEARLAPLKNSVLALAVDAELRGNLLVGHDMLGLLCVLEM